MNDLNNTTNKLEFILGGVYSFMELNNTENTTLSKSEISGFLSLGQDIIKELRDINKTLISNQK